ncbi:MAG: hypothetical protein V4714_02205 [Bacteroidota bacterium]
MNKTHYFLLLRRLGLLLLLYTLCRIVFCLINWGQFGEASDMELGVAFGTGFLFDLSAILLVNALFTVLSILPFDYVNEHSYQWRLGIFFQCLNIPFLVLNIIHAGYFRLSGKRLTPAEGPELETATTDQMWLLVSEYWYVSLVALLVSMLLVWYDPSSFRLRKARILSPMWSWLSIFISLTISLLVFAFMLKSHPLSPDNVPATRQSHLENLSRNATFNLLSRYYDQGAKRVEQ